MSRSLVGVPLAAWGLGRAEGDIWALILLCSLSQSRLWAVQLPPDGQLCGRRHGQAEPTPVPDPLQECPLRPPWPLGHQWVCQLHPAQHCCQPHHHETRKTGLFCLRKEGGQPRSGPEASGCVPPDDSKVKGEAQGGCTEAVFLCSAVTSVVCIVPQGCSYTWPHGVLLRMPLGPLEPWGPCTEGPLGRNAKSVRYVLPSVTCPPLTSPPPRSGF